MFCQLVRKLKLQAIRVHWRSMGNRGEYISSSSPPLCCPNHTLSIPFCVLLRLVSLANIPDRKLPPFPLKVSDIDIIPYPSSLGPISASLILSYTADEIDPTRMDEEPDSDGEVGEVDGSSEGDDEEPVDYVILSKSLR